jgi:hypothetical protein
MPQEANPGEIGPHSVYMGLSEAFRNVSLIVQ